MASNYGPHFGVRRWDEDVAIREGRFKTPTTGDRLLLGTAVEIDFDAPGFMKASDDGVTLRSGVSGLLIYEDQFLVTGPIGTINAPYRQDTSYLAYAQLGRYAVIAGGAGSKFWFRNVDARTTPDGFPFPAIEPVAGLGAGGVANGDFLGWNGTQWETTGPHSAARPAGSWFQVVSLNDAAKIIEVTLLGDEG